MSYSQAPNLDSFLIVSSFANGFLCFADNLSFLQYQDYDTSSSQFGHVLSAHLDPWKKLTRDGQFSGQKSPPKKFTLEILRECRYSEKMKTMQKDFLTEVIKMLILLLPKENNLMQFIVKSGCLHPWWTRNATAINIIPTSRICGEKCQQSIHVYSLLLTIYSDLNAYCC